MTLLFFSIITASAQQFWRDRIDVQDGQILCGLINDWRQSQSLNLTYNSYTMTYIAMRHIDNLLNGTIITDILNNPTVAPRCNAHSWSPTVITRTVVPACCYPVDGCMTDMARLITTKWESPYDGDVAENIYLSRGSGFGAFVDPSVILDSWIRSPSHRATIAQPKAVSCGAVINMTRAGSSIITVASVWIGTTYDLVEGSYRGPPTIIDVDATEMSSVVTSTSTTSIESMSTQSVLASAQTFPTLVPSSTWIFPISIPISTQSKSESKSDDDIILKKYGITEGMFITSLVVGAVLCLAIPATICVIKMNAEFWRADENLTKLQTRNVESAEPTVFLDKYLAAIEKAEQKMDRKRKNNRSTRHRASGLARDRRNRITDTTSEDYTVRKIEKRQVQRSKIMKRADMS